LGVPYAKTAVRLSAIFPIRKTTAKKAFFLKREIPLLSLTQKKATIMKSFAIAKQQLHKINLNFRAIVMAYNSLTTA
jgi:hypothetical protein